jgi:hypothetical protein
VRCCPPSLPQSITDRLPLRLDETILLRPLCFLPREVQQLVISLVVRLPVVVPLVSVRVLVVMVVLDMARPETMGR